MPNNTRLFEFLHKEFHDMVHHMCLGFVKGDIDVANDLTQEVFINTWKALDRFKGASSYKTWIYRITMNTCLNHLRNKKARQQVSIDPALPIPDGSNMGAANANPHHELYQAIGQLGEVDRLVIMMVLDELDYSEIATVVGISEGNLRVKIHRIKKNLKKILEK